MQGWKPCSARVGENLNSLIPSREKLIGIDDDEGAAAAGQDRASGIEDRGGMSEAASAFADFMGFDAERLVQRDWP